MGENVREFAIQLTGRLPLGDVDVQANEVLRRESWRYTGPFTRFNRFKSAFPGLGIATVAFAAYCGYEYLFLQDEHHGHKDVGHVEGHH